MQRIIYLCLLFSIIGCGAPGANDAQSEGGTDYLFARHETLPVKVYVWDSIPLGESTNQAIEALNNTLGAPFEGAIFCENEECAESKNIINVQCDIDNKIPEDHKGMCSKLTSPEGFIVSAEVYISCESKFVNSWALPYVIAHELFHCLGFSDHYESRECLNGPIIDCPNYDNSAVDNIESLMCQEMVDDYNDVYPGQR